jgi:hypothetical protein
MEKNCKEQLITRHEGETHVGRKESRGRTLREVFPAARGKFNQILSAAPVGGAPPNATQHPQQGVEAAHWIVAPTISGEATHMRRRISRKDQWDSFPKVSCDIYIQDSKEVLWYFHRDLRWPIRVKQYDYFSWEQEQDLLSEDYE